MNQPVWEDPAVQIWEEIANLRKQQRECVGWLYPSIIEDQITVLKEKLKQLYQTSSPVAADDVFGTGG